MTRQDIFVNSMYVLLVNKPRNLEIIVIKRSIFAALKNPKTPVGGASKSNWGPAALDNIFVQCFPCLPTNRKPPQTIEIVVIKRSIYVKTLSQLLENRKPPLILNSTYNDAKRLFKIWKKNLLG